MNDKLLPYIDKNKPDIIFLPERTNVVADGNQGMRRGYWKKN